MALPANSEFSRRSNRYCCVLRDSVKMIAFCCGFPLSDSPARALFAASKPRRSAVSSVSPLAFLAIERARSANPRSSSISSFSSATCSGVSFALAFLVSPDSSSSSHSSASSSSSSKSSAMASTNSSLFSEYVTTPSSRVIIFSSVAAMANVEEARSLRSTMVTN